MIIIPIKEGESIERPLKRFKRKFEKTQGLRQLRARRYFTKKSFQTNKIFKKPNKQKLFFFFRKKIWIRRKINQKNKNS